LLKTEKPYSGIEQRNSLRWPADFELSYGTGDELVTGTAVNISESGLSFRGAKLSPVGSEVVLSINVPGKKDEVLRLQAVVRRQEADGLHGAEFLKVTAAQKTSVLEVIYYLIAIRRQ
jgi:hypothetical protein